MLKAFFISKKVGFVTRALEKNILLIGNVSNTRFTKFADLLCFQKMPSNFTIFSY